ncbi:MAG: hypothetical protein LBS35_14615 [Synergistaceae bacterium]|jgi:hypothetical protein|nr:hypothetical protein [Synergistaceae bacterium]
MSVNSVAGNSGILWEEYLERQNKLRQRQTTGASDGATTGANGAAFDLTPDQLLSELQNLEDEPEKLKLLAAEYAAKAKEAASSSSGEQARILNELAADLETVASSGDLSVIEEKLAGGTPAAASNVPNGAGDIQAKSVQGILEEEDDENNNGIPDSIEEFIAMLEAFQESLKADGGKDAANGGALESETDPAKLAAELQSLADDPEKLKARAAELAVQAQEAAESASDGRAEMLRELASDLEDVSQTGDLSVMQAKLTRGRGETSTPDTDETAGVQGDISLESLVAKLNKFKEADTADSESQEVIRELLSAITANLSKQIQAVYAQSGSRLPAISLSG